MSAFPLHSLVHESGRGQLARSHCNRNLPIRDDDMPNGALIFTAPLLIAVLGVAFAEREAETAGNRASVRENKKIWYQ